VQALLEAGRYSSHLPGQDAISMIESVGGALVPSLAEELAEWFTAKVVQVNHSRTAMKKLRIVILGFGTARQKRVLE
jgi:hypothetical protein